MAAYGRERAIVPLLDVRVAEKDVAGEMMSFGGPEQSLAATGHDPWGGISEIAVASKDAVGITGLCLGVDKITDRIVAKAGK